MMLGVSVAQSNSQTGGTEAGSAVMGCKAPSGIVAEHGLRSSGDVALTFDDGPSLTQTPKILAILNRLPAHATFFEEGRHVKGREGLMDEILASDDEIGNHSYHHLAYPGYGELAETNRRIADATGFRPCLFRPPFGLIEPKVLRAAKRLGLELVLWDVDSLDDKHPGVTAIRSNVIGRAQSGSIILLHDGGHHPQTVRALPRIIQGLRARGVGFETVTDLLGGRMLYRR